MICVFFVYAQKQAHFNTFRLYDSLLQLVSAYVFDLCVTNSRFKSALKDRCHYVIPHSTQSSSDSRDFTAVFGLSMHDDRSCHTCPSDYYYFLSSVIHLLTTHEFCVCLCVCVYLCLRGSPLWVVGWSQQNPYQSSLLLGYYTAVTLPTWLFKAFKRNRI